MLEPKRLVKCTQCGGDGSKWIWIDSSYQRGRDCDFCSGDGTISADRLNWLWDRAALGKPGDRAARRCWILGVILAFDVGFAVTSGKEFSFKVFALGLVLTWISAMVARYATACRDQKRIKQWLRNNPEPRERVYRRKKAVAA
ncbi:MAG: hypothetical protein JO033_29115 [Acidobacteriaceae bacterium]|nr:hypothetical protein [Acidobacteriaceae bacterium]